MRQSKFIFALLVTLVCVGSALAQSVRWEPSRGQLGYNQVSELSLVFENCEPELDNFRLPQVDGLQFGQPSQSTETNMVNFKVTQRFSLVFPVRPTTRNTIQVPAFDVKTDKGTVRVSAATYTIGNATVGGSSSNVALDDVAQAKITLPRTSVWAGEVIPVTFTLNLARRYNPQLATRVDWQSSPLVAEEWSQPEAAETLVGGERFVVVTETTRAYAKSPGSVTLLPATQVVNFAVGSSGFGLFPMQQFEPRTLSSKPVDLTVKPLPPAPAGFTGAVGQMTLVSKVVPTSPTVGEPITWTLELAGTGNWPDINGLPQRDVSNDFQVVQPKSKRTMKGNALFEGTLTEDVVLVPTKPGRYTLGPVKFVYFDPESGAYKTISTETVTVNVGATNAPPVQQNAPGSSVQFSLNLPSGNTPPAPTLPTAVPPTPPENLPRDPLAESHHGWTPLTVRPLVILCILSSVLCPLILWLVLAAQRSRVRDPQRIRREAKARLATLLAELRTSGSQPATLSAQLLEWQRHTATLWQIPHAAPGAPLVHASVARYSRDAAPTWAQLWAETDRVQHGPSGALPSDWASRAETALRAVRVPGWPPFSLFAPRHLLPFAFALALMLLPLAAHADAGTDAYKRNDFTAAEKIWQTNAANAPTDWTTRHNLGLALAQQDRWAEATAQWTSAFLLAPRADETRWDLALGLQRSGMAPPELVEFSRGSGKYALARAASPAEWQGALVLASLLIAAALVVLLLSGYGRIRGWAKPVALVTILAAILLAAAATFGLRTYGPLAHPDAVLVWRASLLRSIPTEADTQKTSPLSAGSIAVVTKTFLGWTRLAFAGGQTGWVRSEDIAKLYR